MRENIRQAIHLLFGLGIAALVLILDRATAAAIIGTGLLSGVVLIDLVCRGYKIPVISPLLSYADRCDPLPGRGALFFAVSALVCIILFPQIVVVPALVALSVLDSVSTVAGRRWGRHRIHNGKSWEGTIAGILVTAVVLLPFLSPPLSLVSAILAGMIELFSPVDDNLLIPPAVCIFLTIVPLVT